MKRIYSQFHGFSFAVPSSWNSYEISEWDISEGPTGLGATLFVNSTKFCYGSLMLPAFVFHITERGAKCEGYYTSDGRTECFYVTSNEKYDIYLEFILENGIVGGEYDEVVEGTTNDDLEELQNISSIRNEIKDSFRWES